MANECKRPLPVEIIGNHWIYRETADADAKFYRRDEVDAVFAELEQRIALTVERADQLQARLDMVERKAAGR